MAVVCSGCGASNPDGTLACSLCHQARAITAGVDLDAQSTGANGFLVAPPRPTARIDEREFSRTRAGSTSFGLRGRIVISLICLLPTAGAWFMMGGTDSLGSVTGILVSVLAISPMLFLPGLFLRDAWRSHRVR